MKRITTVLISVFVMAFFFAGCGSKEKPQKKIIRPVKVMTVGSDTSTFGMGYPGITKAAQETDISFRVGGPLIKYNVIEGALVKKGGLIAEIDPRDYIVEVQSAEARYNQTKAESERYYRLWQKGSVAKNDYDRKYANFKQAEARLETARNNLKDTKVYAPFTGYYGPKLVELGDQVRPKQTITKLYDLTTIEVVTTIPEQLAIKFKDFDNYQVRFDVYPDTIFTATLKELEKNPTAEGYPLHLYLDQVNNPDDPAQRKVSSGMSCRVNILLKQSGNENTFVIPIGAVFEGETDSTPSVWILGKDMTVKKQHVALDGFVGRDYVKVKSGLTKGQLIVAAGAKRLVEGEKVKILNQKNFN
jgi:RND family efflux transporter MFP subunit